jgi:competence protein ComEC
VVVLDVGQGDAILIHGGPGRFALVDGGPDPVVLMRKLRQYGVGSIELVVLTHVHADHATGLAALPAQMAIGQIWADTEPHATSASEGLFAAAAAYQVPVVAPRPGAAYQLGSLTLQVEGPLRRYASPNDQSIVITVVGPARSMLLSGDIETHAQADLDRLRADVLKVPHQGAATSDPSWLESVGATEAIVSVGVNDFGHPAPWVIDLLERSALVHRTDQAGDVMVALGR